MAWLVATGFLAGCAQRSQAPESLDGLSPTLAHRPAPIVPTTGAPPTGSTSIVFADLLAEATATSDAMRSLTLGPERVAMLEERLRHAVAPRDELELSLALARELLWNGQTRDSIAIYESVLEELGHETGTAPRRRQVRLHLAVAYLRLGEEENCIALHGAGSCILPIQQAARHVEPRGSKAAIRQLSLLLDEQSSPGLRWLLSLAAMTLGEYPQAVPAEHRLPSHLLEGEASAMPRFIDRAADLGLDAVGLSGGVVVEDFDRDGWLDVMVSSWGVRDRLRLFINRGDGTFNDVSSVAGLDGELGGLNLVQADDNNDGYPDVLVLRGAWLGAAGLHPNSLLRNNGDGTFTNVTLEAGLLAFSPTQVAAWVDYDLDGWLDLFIGNEAGGSVHAACQLFRNNGDGTYTDVAPAVGLDISAFVKGATWGDVDRDGLPDLYLSIFGQHNRLLHNQGPAAGWRFADITARAGVGEPKKSFATWFWDYDNDGHLDLLAASYSGLEAESLDDVIRDQLGEPTEAERLRLFRNTGDGTFEDVTAAVGLDAVLLAMGANFGDLDGDGWLDAYFGTGEPSFATLVPNRMFHNLEGRRFRDISLPGGFGHLQKGHGIAFGDLDNDGDEDIYAVMGGAYTGDVYANAVFVSPDNDNDWITLRLEGVHANRSAIGARVELRLDTPDGPRSLFRSVSAGGSFGASSLQLEVGLGAGSSIREVLVDWPAHGSRSQRFADLSPNATYRLVENQPTATRQ